MLKDAFFECIPEKTAFDWLSDKQSRRYGAFSLVAYWLLGGGLELFVERAVLINLCIYNLYLLLYRQRLFLLL